jgi:hypothetical protein
MPTFTCNHDGTPYASAKPYRVQLKKEGASAPLCLVCGRLMEKASEM